MSRATLTQLRSQLEAVVIDKLFARILSGKISPVTTHAHGPQDEAKKKMYMQTNAINARCAGKSSVPETVPRMATMN
jgi:hypothetical protein